MQERALLPLIHDRVATHIETKLAFAAVFEAYYKRIFNYIAYRVSCRYTAEDLASQVFEKTLSKLPGYSPEKAPLEVWLFAIARNVVNDYYRSQARQRFFSLDSIRELVSGKKSRKRSSSAESAATGYRWRWTRSARRNVTSSP